MLRKPMLVLLMFFLSVLPVRAAGAPAYTVAFGHEDGIRVATLAADGSVAFDFIPHGFFKQGGASLIAPAWSPDQRTLYYTSATKAEPEQFINVYAYDRATHTTTPIVSLDKQDQNNWLTLKLSPDGRYLWLGREFFTNYLVDTQAPPDKRIVATLEDFCTGDVVSWEPDRLYAVGYFACAGKLLSVDLVTGNITQTPDVAFDGLYTTGGWHRFPARTPQIIANQDTAIVRLSFDAPDLLETFAQGQHLAVSGDSQIAVFWDAGQFYQINATTGVPQAIFSGAEPNAHFAGADQVGYWTLKDKMLQLLTVDARGTKSVEFTLPATGAELDAAPDRALTAVLYREQNTFLLYSASGQTFDSTTLPADLLDTFTLFPKDSDTSLTWWLGRYFADGSQYTADGVKHLRFVVDAATGQRMDIPQPVTNFSGTSPDGIWWLFACTDYGATNSPCGASPTLIAVNAMTGKSVTLSDDAYLEEINFHFPPMAYYAWAQP